MRLLARRIAVVSGVVIVVACGSLPHDNGVEWACFGTAVDTDPVTQQDEVIFQGQVASECANPTVPQSDLLKACQSDCFNNFRAYGVWIDGTFPFLSFWKNIKSCGITFAQNTGRKCADPPQITPMNGGPADAQFMLDSTQSTASVDIGGKTGSSSTSGTIDVTFGPGGCTGPVCNIRFSTMHLATAPFTLSSGDNIHDVSVENVGAADGQWGSGGSAYEIPINGLSASINFGVNTDSGSETLQNAFEKITGTLARDYSSLTLSGTVTDGSGNSVALNLVATPTGRPPTASLQPKGNIECNATNVANVTFSSAASTDPDNDIKSRAFYADSTLGSVNHETYNATLSLGPHLVQADVMDSRGAGGEDAENVTVVDTTPPNLTATASPDCLWPPNHKLVLYELGDGLTTSVSDTCDANPTVKIVNVVSNQPALGRGSGNAAPDVEFGSGAFCVRSERDGTVQGDRLYTVTVEAIDTSGNKTQRDVVIRVPHDQGEATNCPLVDASRIVDDSDPRCTQAAPQPIQKNPVMQRPLAAPTNDGAGGGCSASGLRPESNSAALFVPLGLIVFILRRRRRQQHQLAALTTIALAISCNSGANIPNQPVSGTFQGNAFSIRGATAVWNGSHSTLSVMLDDYGSACGAPSPTLQGQGYTEAVLSIPAAKVTTGTYQIQTSVASNSGDVGMGVTEYMVNDGSTSQNTLLVTSGTLAITSVSDTTLAGGISVNQGQINLSGTFSAAICP